MDANEREWVAESVRESMAHGEWLVDGVLRDFGFEISNGAGEAGVFRVRAGLAAESAPPASDILTQAERKIRGQDLWTKVRP